MKDGYTIAAIGDLHISLASRWEEGNRILDFAAGDFEDRKVDLVVITGDVFDKASKPLERLAFARFIQKCGAVAPVVIVRGNHDAPSDLALFDGEFMNTPYRVVVEEAARVHEVGPLLVGCVAWPKKAWMLADNVNTDERTALQDIFRGIAVGFEKDIHGRPRIVAMHGMIGGAKTSLGQPLVGCDMEVALDDLALAQADIVLLGHIHLPQEFGKVNGAPVLYTGSSRRTAFGEVEVKSYVLATLTRGRRYDESESVDRVRWNATCERIPLPATPMLLIDGEYRDGKLTLDAPEAYDNIAGADVRLRFRCTTENREAARAAAERLQTEMLQTAVAVVTDEQLTVVATARVPEIVNATSLTDKLRMFRKARGEVLEPEHETRLAGKVGDLQTV